MDELTPNPPRPVHPMMEDAVYWDLVMRQRQERARRRLLRRLGVLLVLGVVGFSMVTWVLVRVEDPSALLPMGRGPSRVIENYLQALNRGELRTAYNLFSPTYRGQVSFEVYHELIVTHRRMFLTREAKLQSREIGGERTVVDTRLVSTGGERYVARFTLVRLDGRWWIDDLRWSSAPTRRLF
ncbi:MAG TPA: DUF4864 domain-containing protein, partial [Candidatus Acidoferrales bacterium]